MANNRFQLFVSFPEDKVGAVYGISTADSGGKS
jgi:hypothetical protein